MRLAAGEHLLRRHQHGFAGWGGGRSRCAAAGGRSRLALGLGSHRRTAHPLGGGLRRRLVSSGAARAAIGAGHPSSNALAAPGSGHGLVGGLQWSSFTGSSLPAMGGTTGLAPCRRPPAGSWCHSHPARLTRRWAPCSTRPPARRRKARFAPLGLFAILIGRLVGIGAGTALLAASLFPVSCN